MSNEWPKVSLVKCCEIASGATPKSSVAEYWNGEFCWTTPRDLSDLTGPYITDTPRKITEAGLHSCGARLLPPHSVLLSSRAPIGHVAINKVPMATNQGFKSLVPNPEMVDAKYLYHWLRTNRNYLASLGNGATFKEVSKEIVSRVEIPLPQIVEQRRIAKILDQTEILRTKRQEALAQLDKFAQAIFLDTFGDPASNPKGWPTTSVGEVANIQGGLQVTIARMSCPIEVPYLRVANVYHQQLNLGEIKLMRVTSAELARTRLEEGDLLIVEGHGNARQVGRSSLWDGSVENCVHQNHLIRARFDNEHIEPAYASAYLNSPSGHRHLLKSAKTTSGLNTINISNVRATPIRLPPLSLQHKFSSEVKVIERLKVSQRAHLAELDALFASLQYRAFRGEL
jgi:type I restriction enzyme S subunit